MMFSVLIAHYNNAQFLKTALESVLAQQYKNWEVILVDDFSTDNFEEIILPYAADDRIKVFRNEKNYGCGFTKNRCSSLANGELQGFLDPDDALHEEAIAVMIQAHQDHPQCSLIYSTHYICDAGLQIKRIADYVRALPGSTPYLLLGDGSIHLFASFTKKAYALTEGINPLNKKAVDKDLYYQLEEAGQVYFVDKPLYYYRIHQGSISNSGQEGAATLIHYQVAKKACLRRIRKLKAEHNPVNATLIREYRSRYYKLLIFEYYRKKKWVLLFGCALIYSFTGGLTNMVNYARKLRVGGSALLRKSFLENYEIKA